MKKQYLTSLWALSALFAMSQPPLRDTSSVMAEDNTRFIVDSNYVAHHAPLEKPSPKPDSSKKRVHAHEMNKNYMYELNTSSNRSTKTKASVSDKPSRSERQ